MATLNVDADGTVSGGIKTAGIDGTAAHIHLGTAGASGPPIITLEKAGKDQWMVPQGAKLSVHSSPPSRRASSTSTCTARRIRAARYAPSLQPRTRSPLAG